MEKKLIETRLSEVSKQAKGDGRIPKNPDVPRDGYDPKSMQTPLPPKPQKKK